MRFRLFAPCRKTKIQFKRSFETYANSSNLLSLFQRQPNGTVHRRTTSRVRRIHQKQRAKTKRPKGAFCLPLANSLPHAFLTSSDFRGINLRLCVIDKIYRLTPEKRYSGNITALYGIIRNRFKAKKKPKTILTKGVRFRFGLVEATGLAHQRLLTQSNRVQCDLGHRHGIAVGGIATFEPVPDNKKIRPDGRKDFGGAVIT